MKSSNNIFLFLLLFSLTNCDPGLSGDLKVYNESNQVLTIKFKNSYVASSDTTTKDVQPNSYEIINILSGLGNKKTVGDCCPCYVDLVQIKSPLGVIKKDATNKDNWVVPNKSKLRKFGKEPVKCEFHVTQADL